MSLVSMLSTSHVQVGRPPDVFAFSAGDTALALAGRSLSGSYNLNQPNGFGDASDVHVPARQVVQLVHSTGKVNDTFGGQHFSGLRQAAEPGRPVQGAPPIPTLDPNCISCIQADAGVQVE